MKNIIKAGPNVIKAHLEHLEEHGETGFLKVAWEVLAEEGITVDEPKKEAPPAFHGCPGSRMLVMDKQEEQEADGTEGPAPTSTLAQWPIQLKLLSPYAPYFKDCDLLVAADCVPFAHADFHQSFLKGKSLAMLCPKLDDGLERYVEKLTELFRHNTVKSVQVLRMEVPCCGGVRRIVEVAMQQAGVTLPIEEVTVSVRGQIL